MKVIKVNMSSGRTYYINPEQNDFINVEEAFKFLQGLYPEDYVKITDYKTGETVHTHGGFIESYSVVNYEEEF